MNWWGEEERASDPTYEGFSCHGDLSLQTASMKSDSDIAIERVQSEALGVLMSIHSHREIERTYFDRLREAVLSAVEFFKDEASVPPELVGEVMGASQILRNEATAFPGRTTTCLEMADWLDAQHERLVRSG